MRPVSERIALVLFDRLQELAAQLDPTNTVVSEVVRPTRYATYTPQHNQIVIVQESPEIDAQLSHAGNPPSVAWRQRFKVHCHVMPSELDPTTLDSLINNFVADVVVAICQPASSWHTFGNLAINAMIEGPQIIEASGGVAGMTVPVLVVYRTSELSPYEMRA